MKNEFMAYIAGYIDGDGCLYIGKTIQKPKMILVYEYSIQIASVKRPVLDLFMDTCVGSIRKKLHEPNHRDTFCWTIKGPNAINLAEQTFPYLVDKKAQ